MTQPRALVAWGGWEGHTPEASARRVAEMLEGDFGRSTQLDRDELENHTLWFRLAAHGTRLLAPVL